MTAIAVPSSGQGLARCELWLAIVIAGMASLSTVLLGMGQHELLWPVLTILAATVSVTFTDWLGWFHLHRILANVAMLLAAIFTLNDFLRLSSNEQLHAIARLLTYVQIVLMLQQKNVRIYGQLTMFSLLQIVVAALLNDSLEFGALLIVYLAFAVIGITLFFIHREVSRTGVMQSRRRWLSWPVRRPGGTQSSNGVPGPARFELLDDHGALQNSLLTLRLAAPLLGLGVAMLVFDAVFFLATPRTGGGNWEGGAATRSVVGFAPEVSFDDMGKLLQNDARAMRVSFTNAKSNEVYTVVGEPYFRGAVLTKYLTGRWHQEAESFSTASVPLATPPDTRELVREAILLEPTGQSQLFSIFPVYAISETPESLRLGTRTSRLHRVGYSQRELREEFRYSLATTAFRFGAQFHVMPETNRLQTAHDRMLLERMKLRLQFLDSRQQFPGLIRLAEQIVREKAANGNALERARALELHFLEANAYTYSIDFDEINGQRQPQLDPIEDFVTNHRRGHCEYFASALTLMLRSQNIPARMVIGYKGGDFNYVGDYFVVRQRDAHAWVEAYVAESEIPTEAMCPEERHPGGGWLRLDPTPSTDAEERIQQHGLFDRASKSFDYARWLWNDYVLHLTAGRQESSILRPFAPNRELRLGELMEAESWRNLAERASGLSAAAGSSGYSIRGGMAALIVCGIIVGLYKLARFVRPKWRFSLPRRSAVASLPVRHRIVLFYQRLEILLSRLGLQRHPAQTQQEFAIQAAARLAIAEEHADVARVPEAVVRAYYRVRFSDWAPSSEQTAQITSELDRLEQAVAKQTAHRGTSDGNGPPRTHGV
jgi:transglutaminase-like putative cysteine protease